MEIKAFTGLQNVSDPMRLDMASLITANNVNITDTGAISKREGYALSRAGSFTSAYSTADFSRMYLVDGNSITAFDGTVIESILDASAQMHWCEINDQVFFNNGIDSGIINRDNSVMDWRWTVSDAPKLAAVTGTLPAGTYQVLVTQTLDDGRETGASDTVSIEISEGQAMQITANGNVYIAPANSTVFQFAGAYAGAFVWNSSPDYLGRDFLNDLLDPLPLGVDEIQAWQGRIYACQYMPTQGQTVIWYSEPLGFHLFNLTANFIIVPGRVHMLAPNGSALVIGTGERVYAYDGQKLVQVADYGVVPGQHWALDGERILFWSARGLCAFAPFSNLTEHQVSVAPGVRAGAALVRNGGQKRYLAVIQQGGAAFNYLS